MKAVEQVAILGAGALGSYFATRFFDAPGLTTVLIARGERHQRLSRQGLVVNGQPYMIPVVDPDGDPAPLDLILVALKYHHLPAAVPDLKNLVGPDTTIISVMNGLDSEEIIGAVYGMDKLLYAVSVGIDALREGNRVTYGNPGVLYFGEAENADPSPQVRRVQAALDRAAIPYEIPVDMMRILWWKFMVNVGMNQASAVMRATYGVFQTSARARAVMDMLMHEVIALAQTIGVDLSEKDVADWVPIMHKLLPGGKTSMLQDIEAGRKTEVEMLAGKMVELGQAHGVPTPVNEAMLNIIHILEAGPPD
jgi:2-dehydropantoate 2-reductase